MENFSYLCAVNISVMMKFKVFYTEEALEFLGSMPPAAREKMYYNIAKVADGNRDVGIVKKTQKTPKKEIEKAEKIRKLYYEKD